MMITTITTIIDQMLSSPDAPLQSFLEISVTKLKRTISLICKQQRCRASATTLDSREPRVNQFHPFLIILPFLVYLVCVFPLSVPLRLCLRVKHSSNQFLLEFSIPVFFTSASFSLTRRVNTLKLQKLLWHMHTQKSVFLPATQSRMDASTQPAGQTLTGWQPARASPLTIGNNLWAVQHGALRPMRILFIAGTYRC